MALLVVVVLLLVVGGVVAAALLLGGGSGKPDAHINTPSAKASASASASAPTRASASASSAGGSASLPAGWHQFRNDSLGWSIGVPPGWRVRNEGDTATFTDPSGGRYARIDTRYPAGSSAVGAWQDQERAFSGSHPGYRRIQLATVDQSGYRDAADWEFVYNSGAARLHALDRALVTNGNRGYAVYFQTHDDQWSSSNDLLQGFLSSFRPGPR